MRVPQYETQAGASSLPGVQVAAPQGQDFAGRQTAQLADTVMGSGKVLSGIAMDIQAEANQMRVRDALNKAKEAQMEALYNPQTGLYNQKGIAALERPSKKPIFNEYGDNFQKTLDELEKGLGNDEQRALFRQEATGMSQSLREQGMRHFQAQSNAYYESVDDGQIATAQREIALNYNNPDAIDKATQRIDQAVYSMGRRNGLSAEWMQATSLKQTSNAVRTAIMTGLEQGRPDVADAMLTKYKDKLDPNDLLFVKGHITKEVDQQTVAQSVQKAMAPVVQPKGAADNLFGALLQQESGSQHFDANGNVKKSRVGAVGIAQIMPGTGPEAAKDAGLKWDPVRFEKDPEYNRALGQGHFNKLLRVFNGNVPQALAAYNAGAGAVMDFRDGTNKTGKNPNKIKTPDGIPPFAETQKYVKSIMARSGAPAAQQAPTLETVNAQLAADPALANKPDLLAAAQREAARQFSVNRQAEKDRQEQVEAAATQWILDNPGKPYSALPLQIRAQLDANAQRTLFNFAESQSKRTESSNPVAYMKLSDPNFLRGLSDNQFLMMRPHFTESDFKHFAGERGKLLGKPGTDSAGDLNSTAINQSLDSRLSVFGVNSKPKEGSDEERQLGGVKMFINRHFMMKQLLLGRKMTDTEVEAEMDYVFTRTALVKHTFGSNEEIPAALIGFNQIPYETRGAVYDDLKKAIGRNPSEQEVVAEYRRRKFYGANK